MNFTYNLYIIHKYVKFANLILNEMNETKQSYVIKFAGLADGLTQFDFEINEKFFAGFEYSEIERGDVKVHLTLEKKMRMLILNFNFEGFICLPCDICLKEIVFPISSQEQLLIKFGSEKELFKGDDVWVISEKDSQIDLSHYLYEAIAVLRPIQLVHEVGEDGVSLCDPEMFKIYTSLKVEDRDENSTAQVDQRWNKLTELL